MKVSSSGVKFFSIVTGIIVYGLKIIGLAPFSIKMTKEFSSKNPNRYSARIFSFSKIGLAYEIFLSVLIPVMAGLTFPKLFSLNYDDESSVTRTTDICQGILCVFTFWMIIFTWIFNQRKAVCILNKIFQIHLKISGINKKPLNKMTFLFLTTHLIINFSLWVTIYVTESTQPVISDVFVNWFLFTVPSFVIYWFTLEYFMVVGLVASNFEIVNKNLSNFKEFTSYQTPQIFVNDYSTDWNSSNQHQLELLNSLHIIRTALFDISQEIAEFFSFPILPCVAYSFVSLVYNVYFLIVLAVPQNRKFSLATASNGVAWILSTLYPLAVLFYNVTKTVEEAKLTGRIIHKLLSTVVKEEIKTELELFSIQLIHENIDFTAYGFFALDFTLLHSMLGAAATYLVILIQFQ